MLTLTSVLNYLLMLTLTIVSEKFPKNIFLTSFFFNATENSFKFNVGNSAG